MSKRPSRFEETLLFLQSKLEGKQYAFRGTASLVLQGLKMNVDDIDVLADKDTALLCNNLFEGYLVEEVSFKEADKFRSYFGKFRINEILVEVMGQWQIKDTKGGWSVPFNASKGEITMVKLEDREVPVTKVETELDMFAKMGRWNAFHKIRRQCESRKQEELFE